MGKFLFSWACLGVIVVIGAGYLLQLIPNIITDQVGFPMPATKAFFAYEITPGLIKIAFVIAAALLFYFFIFLPFRTLCRWAVGK